MCFQVQSVQKHLRACVIPSGKVAPCMCVLPDLLPHSFIFPTSLQFKKQQKKAPKNPLALKICDCSALEPLCVSQICAGADPALFSLNLHIKTSAIQAKRKWVVWSELFFFSPLLSFFPFSADPDPAFQSYKRE